MKLGHMIMCCGHGSDRIVLSLRRKIVRCGHGIGAVGGGAGGGVGGVAVAPESATRIIIEGAAASVTNIIRDGVQISALDKETNERREHLPGSHQDRRCGTREIRIDGSRIEGDRYDPLVFVSSCEFIREQNISLLGDQNLVPFAKGNVDQPICSGH
jgi:hypothetical protein